MTWKPGDTVTTPCRKWHRALAGKGYGVKRRRDGSNDYLHRWVMEQIHGREAIKGKYVMHLCDTPSCYRYSHLRIGTVGDNNRDMVAKGRGRWG